VDNSTVGTNGSSAASYTFQTVLSNGVTVTYNFETFNASMDLDIGTSFNVHLMLCRF
jgi:hypothetical protein